MQLDWSVLRYKFVLARVAHHGLPEARGIIVARHLLSADHLGSHQSANETPNDMNHEKGIQSAARAISSPHDKNTRRSTRA